MIAPTACRRKGPSDHRAEIIARRIVRDPLPGKKCSVTGSLAEIIIRPNFRPATALLDCDKQSLRWPGPFSSGFLSPQPPGAVGIGPVRRIVYPPPWANESWSFFFWGMLSFRGAIAFQAKACPGLDPGWKPVRVKKARQIKNLEPSFRFYRNGRGSAASPESPSNTFVDSWPAPSGAFRNDGAENELMEVSEATCRPRRASGPVCRDCHPGHRPPRHRRPRWKYLPAARSSCRNGRSSHLP
jgi:hypothetical protein